MTFEHGRAVFAPGEREALDREHAAQLDRRIAAEEARGSRADLGYLLTLRDRRQMLTERIGEQNHVY